MLLHFIDKDKPEYVEYIIVSSNLVYFLFQSSKNIFFVVTAIPSDGICPNTQASMSALPKFKYFKLLV